MKSRHSVRPRQVSDNVDSSTKSIIIKVQQVTDSSVSDEVEIPLLDNSGIGTTTLEIAQPTTLD